MVRYIYKKESTANISRQDVLAMGNDVEDPSNYPRLKQYDAWCKRVDEITTAKGWKELNDVAAEEG